MEKPKAVVLDGFALTANDLSWEWLENITDAKVYDRTPAPLVAERAAGCPIVLTNKVVFDAVLMDSLPDLKYIGVLATGYNTIDIKAAKERGITVTNIPAYSTMSVAQSVFALLLGLTNRVEHYATLNRSGVWTASPDFCYWNTPLTELDGKTFGIVGFGNIGRAVARIALAFGMKVIAYTSKSQKDLPQGVVKASRDEIFSLSDVVSLHCPLTPETRGLVNRENLSLMKPTAIIINTSRGPVVDDNALAEALRNGRIAGAALDVLSQEPPEDSNPLLTAPNCIITPHIAWATREARERLMNIAKENLLSYLSSSPVNVVS